SRRSRTLCLRFFAQALVTPRSALRLPAAHRRNAMLTRDQPSCADWLLDGTLVSLEVDESDGVDELDGLDGLDGLSVTVGVAVLVTAGAVWVTVGVVTTTDGVTVLVTVGALPV